MKKDKGRFGDMKLKRWLAVMMSVMLVASSFPVYAIEEDAEEVTKETLAEETDDKEKIEAEISSADEVMSTLETEVPGGLDLSTDSETNMDDETGTESVTELEETAESEEIKAEEAKEDETKIEEQGNEASGDIASGTYGDITWVIDKDGKLTVTGSGEFSDVTSSDRAPWYANRESIISAVVSIEDIFNLSWMFNECKNLTDINLNKLDASNATNMWGMFSGCSSLTNVDVSSLDTGNVTDMHGMFYNCSSLTSVDVSTFDTKSVTNMRLMFYSCKNLTTVDVSGFDTKNVINMHGMFYNCENLTSVDVSGFNTGNVTAFGHMFHGCKNLKNVNTGSFSTENATDMSGMFLDCNNLTNIDVSGFDTRNVTNMEDMFGNCSSLTSIDVSDFDTGNATSIRRMFSGCSSLANVDVSGFDTGNATSIGGMFYGCGNLTSVDVSGFDTRNAISTSSMFYGCSSLTSIDVGNFDTNKVTNMEFMFYGCSSLTNIDVSGFNTRNVTDMRYMFYNCNSLVSIDVSNFDTGNVKYIGEMFAGCSNLMTIDVSNFETGNVIGIERIFYGCGNLTSLDLSSFDLSNVGNDAQEIILECTCLTTIQTPKNVVKEIRLPSIIGYSWYYNEAEIVTIPQNLSYSVEIKRKENIVPSDDIASGTYGDITWVIDKDGKLTVIGRGEFSNKTITERAPWYDNRKSITLAEILVEDITDLSFMFYDCSNLESINLEKLDTSNVTHMEGMFEGCSSLTNIDVHNFDTRNVTNMSCMFEGCTSLTSIDVNNFNTENTNDMSHMFNGCSSLTNLDVSGFNTKNVIDMWGMFWDCSSLTNIDVHNFDTRNVTNMSCMFEGCTSLTSIDVNNFNTENTIDMSYMFNGCSSLTSMNVGRFNTENVTDIARMFWNCTSLTSLDLGSFDLKNVVNSQDMLGQCMQLDIMQTPKNVTVEILLPVTAGYSWYYNETEFTSLPQNLNYSVELKRKENTATPDNIASGTYADIAWVIDANGKLTITGSGEFSSEASGVERAPWYSNRESIISAEIIVNGITNLKWMFFECTNLTSVDLSRLDTGNVTDMSGMFSRCSKLANIDVSGFHTENVKDMGAMFFNCSSLANIDLSNFHTENVINMATMFSGCSSLASVDVSSFNTTSVKDMNFMFLNCGNLTSLNLSSFDLVNVADTQQNLFEGCNGLVTIQTPKNIAVEIPLPESGWYYNGAELTALPQNLNYGVEIKKGKDTEEKPEEPDVPAIITTEITNAVQNVPYEAVLQNNGFAAASYQISSGALPTGIDLGTDGVIYGVTKEAGKYKFTVTMTVNNQPATAEMTYTLNVLKSTDNVVDRIEEPGYEIIQPIPNINLKQGITDVLFISNGSYEEFRNAYIDGDRLEKDVDYTAESGSTRITIKAETLGKLGTGKHTLGVEFRTKEGSLKRVAQNFTIKNGNSGGSKSGGFKDDGLNDAGQENAILAKSLSEMADFILWEIPHPEQIDEYGYYPVDIAFVSEENAAMTSGLLGKYYGQQAYLMMHLGNGIGYSIPATDIDLGLTPLNLSAVLNPLDDFADGFATFQVHPLNEALLPYRIGLHVNVGAKYSGKAAYLFRYDKALGTYVPVGVTIVSENGNIMMGIEETTDIIIMIEQ